MNERIARRRSEAIRKRKNTLFKKAHELGTISGVDVAVFVFHRNQFFTYKSLEKDSWPPSISEMQFMYPLPIHLGPKDIERRLEPKNSSVASPLTNVKGIDHQIKQVDILDTIEEDVVQNGIEEDVDTNEVGMSEDIDTHIGDADEE